MSAKDCCTYLPNGNRSWKGENVGSLGYEEGCILRVGMLNFLTYEEGEVFPGPKLNIILGPNGTGKSTITHAICLACCGKPDTLGRTNQLNQFVKHGTPDGADSFVEVDILRSKVTGEVVCIRRYLDSKANKSKYSLNFKNSTEKECKRIVLSMNIDVGKYTIYTYILGCLLVCICSRPHPSLLLLLLLLLLLFIKSILTNNYTHLFLVHMLVNNVNNMNITS
jgi:hypothetical protein